MMIGRFFLGAGVLLGSFGAAPGVRADADQVGGVVGGVVNPTQQPTVRDRVPPAQVGRAALRGRVVDGHTGAALPRARVRLMGPGVVRPAVLTDDQGLFTFTGLPAGGYTVSADKATYMAGSYPDRGGSLRSSAARPLLLKDGEAIDNVVVRLYRGSAITGRVLDAHGDPVESAQVAALAVTGSGAARAGYRSMMSTNDIGEFRIGRVPPGRYVLMANAPQGRFQEGMVEATPLPQPVPTYFPNVLSKSEAQPISVGRGQTVSGIEIVMFEDMPTVVTGRVISADGQPVTSTSGGGAMVSVRLDTADNRGLQGSYASYGTGVRPDGSFRLLLPPGNYVLEARRMQQPAASSQGRPTEEFGMTKVSVAAESIDVSILIGSGATASGRVVFEGATPPPAPPARAGAPLNSQDGVMCRSGQLEIAPDWTFKLDGLVGTCSAPPYGMFGRWTLKSVSFNGQELKNGSMTFEPGQHYGNVQILVTDRRTELNLHVTDERGQPTRDYVALVFSTDKSRWDGSSPVVRSFVPPSAEMLEAMQRAAASRTGQSNLPASLGKEMLAGLPSGEYYAIALDDIDSEGSRDPAVLERLAPSAVRVTIAEGATDVTLARLRQADVIR
jgi:Carboxypeptidase regulatory-like domain